MLELANTYKEIMAVGAAEMEIIVASKHQALNVRM